MIIYVVGVPGAGKTFFAVDKIFEFVKKDTYNNIYTNINQFNFSFSYKIHSFNFDEFYQNILYLYNIYKDKNSNDDDLIQAVKSLNYYKSVFFIDECHNYFDNLDPVLVWLFSYHRHIFIDFYLITQNLALVETKYKKFAEYFIRAVPVSLQLFSNSFTYKKFIDSRMSQKSFVGVIKVKKNKEIFDLYQSGDTVKSSNVIKKYLLFFLFGLIFTFFLFKIILSFFGGHNAKHIQRVNLPISGGARSSVSSGYYKISSAKQIKQFSSDAKLSVDNEDYINSSSSLFYFICYKKICHLKYTDFIFNITSFPSIIKFFNCSLVYKDSNRFNTAYLLSCNKNLSSIYNIFKGVHNDDFTKNDSNINPLP